MKSEELLKAVGEVDEKFVEEAAPADAKVIELNRAKRWQKWTAGIAAALVVCILGGTMFFFGMGGAKSVQATDAVYEAENFSGYNKKYDSGYMDLNAPKEEPSAPSREMGKEESYYTADSNLVQNSIKNLNKDNLKLIYYASMQLQTTDYAEAESAIYKQVEAVGGYFQNVNVNNSSYYASDNYKSGNYTVRVPAERYADFINSVGETCHVVNISQSVEDVGESYFELEGRLETLRTKRDRLNELLKDAATMTDIIQLESELSNTEYEIENLTTRINHYDSLIGYSTVNIYLEQVIRTDTGVSQDNSFGARLVRSFKRGLTNFANDLEDLAFWFARNIIGIIIFVVIVFLIIKFNLLYKLFMLIKKLFTGKVQKKDK